MFEKTEGFDDGGIGARLLWNLAGPSLKRIALTLGEDSETATIELIQKVKSKLMQRLPPREVNTDEAPVFENTLLGDDIDLDKFPIPMHWPLDGGRYPGTADYCDHARSGHWLLERRYLSNDAAGQTPLWALPLAG